MKNEMYGSRILSYLFPCIFSQLLIFIVIELRWRPVGRLELRYKFAPVNAAINKIYIFSTYGPFLHT